MKQQPDKLFRDKLANQSMQAPEAAWSRIENSLPAQRTPWLYLKIAASIILLISLSILFWPIEQSTKILSDNTKPTEKIRSQKDQVTKNSIKENPDTAKTKMNDAVKSKVNRENSTLQKNQKKANIPITNFTKTEHLLAENTHSTKESTIEISDAVNNGAITEVINTDMNTVAEISQTSLSESTTIVLAANDVSKYLKQTEVDDATSDLDNTSSFRKLLDKAADLKNNQSGLAELRQKKNEILALNFRNEKRERNN